MSTIRSAVAAAVTFAAGILLPLGANAQLQLSCPVNWSALSDLNGTDLDRQVLGVRVRDWQEEHLAQMRQKMQACLATSGWPESLKAATREDAARLTQNAQRALQQRDRRVAAERQQADTRQKIAQSGIPGVRTTERGILLISGPDLYEEQPCGGDPERFRGLVLRRRDTYVGFMNLCVAAGQLTPQQAAAAHAFLDGVDKENQSIAQFRSKLATLKANPQSVNHRELQQLESDASAITARLNSRPGDARLAQFEAPTRELRALREALDQRECPEYMRQAGMPKELLKAQYLIEVHNPDDLENMVCWARRNGAQVRYLVGGLGRKEGFEVKGKRTVQVRTERVMAPDATTIILVPVSGTVNGEPVQVVEENFRSFTEHLVNAIGNR